MNKTVTFCSLAVIMICISSCRIQNPRYFNSPSAQAPVYLEKKGDKRVTANIAILPKHENSEFDQLLNSSGARNSYTVGFDLGTAYAFSDRFMGTLGGFYRKEKDAFSDNDILQTKSTSKINYTRKAFDVGLGTLIPFGEQKIMIFNPIIGTNFGRSESFLYSTSNTTRDTRIFYFHGNYHKFYLKPNLNFHFNKNFKMSFIPQVSVMKYHDIEDNYPGDSQEFLGLNRLRKENMWLFEPATFYQIGLNEQEWLKLDLGIAFSFYPHAKDIPEKLRTRNVQLSIGFSIYP
ncbi:hypothetical protein [Proteiniphilum sp.]|uniref:hypothetical protein n=1 Tax=Proteiniphilum sp. TaxID=1926877 RepID=UPI002B1FB4B9|nr:hypothetical protein [Proteiniphilum sp.]MEA4916168.1 hypothetical protein [Proteiniphilum sp.]